LIIIAVKAWQVKDISKDLRNSIDENCIILPLQNGVLAFDEISGELGKKFVIGGLCRILSKIGSPGVIEHMGLEPTIIFGEWNNNKTERINKLKELFDKAGIKSSIAEDIQAELWKKFITICVGGLLALTRSTYGIAREVPETRDIMKELLTEIYTLAVKTGIKLGDDHVEKTMQYIDAFPYDARSSLTRDIMEGRPSEIEYQNGSVVKLGEKYGIKTPVNKFIYNCLLPMELSARGKLR
jgi:2-dehydropantoate 2-reductase